MNNKRINCSSITIQSKLFVLGGYDYPNYLNSNEMLELIKKKENENFDFNNNLKWMNLKNMKYAKQSSGIKYFQNKNQIILIGGWNHYNNEEIPRSFSIFEVVKNEFIEYPNTS